MDWQTIVVILIGVGIALHLGYGVYKFFFNKSSDNQSVCSGCNCSKVRKKTGI